ncbi:anti-anti-sigma factor [Actinokineospora spheciospongiae]|nr:anti-anti-sigma factor [Actinokineospora spheciospongiae]
MTTPGTPSPRDDTAGARVIAYRPDIGVALLRGDLDLTAEQSVRDVLAALLEPTAILDLTSVGLLSASCLGLVVREAGERQRRGHALALVAGDGLALRVLRISGADTWIPVFPSLSDAVREVDSWASDQVAAGSPHRTHSPG